jgi:hypothetical protein
VTQLIDSQEPVLNLTTHGPAAVKRALRGENVQRPGGIQNKFDDAER